MLDIHSMHVFEYVPVYLIYIYMYIVWVHIQICVYTYVNRYTVINLAGYLHLYVHEPQH